MKRARRGADPIDGARPGAVGAPRRIVLRAITGCGAALGAAMLEPARAQGQWPAGRPITIVVPFTAGGNVDTTARLVADKLGARLEQSVIVDNVPEPGASSVPAASFSRRRTVIPC